MDIFNCHEVIYMITELAAFLVYCIGMSFTPGPNNLMSLSVSQKVGFKRAVPFLWGLFFSFFIINGAAYLCSSTLQELIPQLETLFKALGSLYILYLTYKIVKPPSKTSEKEEKNIKSRLFISGFVLNLTNIKVMLFFLMGYMVFILPAFTSLVPRLLLGIIMCLLCSVSNVLWALAGAAFRHYFAAHERVTSIVLGLLLLFSVVEIWL